MRKQMSVLAMLVALGGSAFAGSREMLKMREQAPYFFLRDLEGAMHRLSDMAFPGKETSWRKKRKVLLDFFRTDCKPCMKELPHVIEFHNKHKGEIQVLMVALLEEDDGRAKLDHWLRTTNPPFPVLVDAYETVAKKYIVKGESISLPSMYLIDQDGIVRAKLEGFTEDLEESLFATVAAQEQATPDKPTQETTTATESTQETQETQQP